MGFREHTSSEKVEARSAGKILHDYPKLVRNNEGSIIPSYILRLALCEAGDLLLNLRYVVIRILQIYIMKILMRISNRLQEEISAYLFDGYYLLGIIVNGLVDYPEAARPKLLEQSVLGRRIVAGNGVWFPWSRFVFSLRRRWRRSGEYLGLRGKGVSTTYSEAGAGRHGGLNTVRRLPERP
jgi:hypothetical protein